MIDIEIEINRVWRLIVTKPDVETEYVVAEEFLGPLILDIASDLSVCDVQCAPLPASTHEGIWMASRAPRAAA